MKQASCKLNRMVVILCFGIISGIGFASETAVFQDDFEYYDVDATRIFDTGNFGGI